MTKARKDLAVKFIFHHIYSELGREGEKRHLQISNRIQKKFPQGFQRCSNRDNWTDVFFFPPTHCNTLCSCGAIKDLTWHVVTRKTDASSCCYVYTTVAKAGLRSAWHFGKSKSTVTVTLVSILKSQASVGTLWCDVQRLAPPGAGPGNSHCAPRRCSPRAGRDREPDRPRWGDRQGFRTLQFHCKNVSIFLKSENKEANIREQMPPHLRGHGTRPKLSPM